MTQNAFHTTWERLRSFVIRRRTARGTLRDFIREDESAVGYDRNNVRAKAKEWLLAHGSSLAAQDVLLARNHFGYLLPVGWGGG
jgi:hypothetical protein